MPNPGGRGLVSPNPDGGWSSRADGHSNAEAQRRGDAERCTRGVWVWHRQAHTLFPLPLDSDGKVRPTPGSAGGSPAPGRGLAPPNPYLITNPPFTIRVRGVGERVQSVGMPVTVRAYGAGLQPFEPAPLPVILHSAFCILCPRPQICY